jgi:hypothetical protein
MGGAAEWVGKLASDLGSKLTESLRTSGEIGTQAHTTFFSQESELARSPEGHVAMKLLKDYDFRRNQILTQLQKSPQQIEDVIKNNPDQLRSTIGKLHSDFSQQGHPVAQHTAAILNLDPKNFDLTLPEYTAKIGGQARLLARLEVVGANSEKLVKAVMPLYLKGDTVEESHANAILSIAANQFHDTSYPMVLDAAGVRPSTVPHSATKLDMQKALMAMNQQLKAEGKPEINTRINTANVYERMNALEKFSSQRVRWYLAPMIAINHMSTFFNTSQAPLEGIYKGLASLGDKEIKDLTDASAVLGSQHFHMLLDDMSSRTGMLATKIGRPEVGALYSQIFHNPGFNFIRNAQLKFSAAVGYHSALYWAENAARGDKRSLLELRELGLDPQAIVQRGGQLTRDEKVKAIWNFTNNRSFISRPLDRSLTATATPWGRMLTMFHGYVTYQQRFMRRELQKMLDAGDYAGIARFAGTVGMLFPTVAPMLKAAEVFGRTASPKQAIAGMKEDYNRLEHPEDTAQFAAEYLDMLSYFGSWGTMHSFITAAHGDRLALALMGPTAGSTVRAGQDLINLATKSTKSGRHNIKPLAKDILQQTVPGAGNILANQIFPAKDINK